MDSHDALMHDGGARLPPCLGHRRRDARADRPDDLEILEAPPAPPRSSLEVRQHRVHDPAVKSDQEHDAVGDLAGELDGLRPRGRHQEGYRPARGVGETPRRALKVHGFARQQLAQGRDARAHLGERGRLSADRARRRVTRAHDDLRAPRRQLGDGLDRAGQDGDVPRERVGHRRKQRQPRRAGGCLPERDERVAAQELTVEDPRAVEAGGLDVLDQPDQLRHR